MEPLSKPVREQLWDAIMELHNTNRLISRQMLSDLTSLKLSIVDDHVKRMKDDGQLRMVVNGIYEPVVIYREDRAISGTLIPRGGFKLEIGDTVLDLTLTEARNLARITGGLFFDFGRG